MKLFEIELIDGRKQHVHAMAFQVKDNGTLVFNVISEIGTGRLQGLMEREAVRTYGPHAWSSVEEVKE